MNLGYQPASFLEWEESERSANQIALNAIKLMLIAAISHVEVAVKAHREAVGGMSLVVGLALATGADTLPQALLKLAAFAVAGACLHEKEEKGGAA